MSAVVLCKYLYQVIFENLTFIPGYNPLTESRSLIFKNPVLWTLSFNYIKTIFILYHCWLMFISDVLFCNLFVLPTLHFLMSNFLSNSHFYSSHFHTCSGYIRNPNSRLEAFCSPGKWSALASVALLSCDWESYYSFWLQTLSLPLAHYLTWNL